MTGWWRLACWGLMVCLSAACRPRPDNAQVRLPAPVEANTLGPGDLLTVQIVGERDLPTEYQVASDGTIDLPYVHRLRVEGLEPQRVQELVRQRLIAERIFTDPSVVVRVLAHHSKRVVVLGQVREPGSFPLEPGLTLVQAISLAGGLNSIADSDRIRVSRRTADGTQTVTVSVRAITDGRAPDIPLQAGDRIFIDARLF